MRDFLVMFVVLGSLPVVIVSPFYGILVYSWLSYMRPQDLAWNLADSHLSFYVAMLLLAGLLFALLQGRERLMSVRIETLLLIALVVWIALGSRDAREPDIAAWYWSMLMKGVLIAVITTGLAITKNRLQLLVGVIAFSLGVVGLKYAIFGLLRGGVRIVKGPGGFMSDNNGLAAAMVIAVPLLAAIAWSEERRAIRISARVMMAACAITVVFTFSRGGLLALGAVGAVLALRSKRPLLTSTILIVGLPVLGYVTSEGFLESYLNRADSIRSFEQDSSAMGRINAWGTAMDVSFDYPLLGVGLGNFPVVYHEYSNTKAKVAHNSFFQLLAEGGYPSAFMWLLIMATSVLRLQRIHRRASEHDLWLRSYARSFQIALMGYFVGAMFLDLALFDLFYHLIALGVCLELAAQGETVEEVAAAPQADKEQWWRQTPASVQS